MRFATEIKFRRNRGIGTDPVRTLTDRLKARVRTSLGLSGRPGGPPKEVDFALAVPFGFVPNLQNRPRVGVVIHLYHAELAHEFAHVVAHIDNVCGSTRVMITTDTEEKAAAIRAAFRGRSEEGLKVRLVENRGRDIATKLTAFVDDYHGFDLLLFLHSKITERSPAGNDWRKKTLAELAGSTEVVESILAVFEAEPTTGMVFPQHFEAGRGCTGWEANFAIAKRLTRPWGVKLKRRGEMDFPSGSMFWARPAALMPIIALGLTIEDFPTEPLANDGTIAHAIERLFTLAAECAGHRWYKVAAPEWYEYRDSIFNPQSATELRQYLATRHRSLLSTMVRRSTRNH